MTADASIEVSSLEAMVMNVFDPQLQYCMPTAPPFRSEQSVIDPKDEPQHHSTVSRTINDPLSQVFTERFR
jgi:hypothetical protein